MRLSRLSFAAAALLVGCIWSVQSSARAEGVRWGNCHSQFGSPKSEEGTVLCVVTEEEIRAVPPEDITTIAVFSCYRLNPGGNLRNFSLNGLFKGSIKIMPPNETIHMLRVTQAALNDGCALTWFTFVVK